MKLFFTSLISICFFFDAFAGPIYGSIENNNRNRNFIIYLPVDFQMEEELPLVINMHPFLGTGAGQMNYTQYNNVADTARCIVVYPNAINRSWNSGGVLEDFFGFDDVGFLNGLIDYMSAFYNIDSRRVYSTGYSAGGFMSYQLACKMTNRLAAIAPVSSSMNALDDCIPDRPIPTLIMNGTADPIVQYNGFIGVVGIDDVVGFWQEANRCDVEPLIEDMPNINTTDGSTVKRITYQNCDGGVEMIFYKIQNGGHIWPDARETFILGRTNRDINANYETWTFFNRYSIPEDIACDKPTNLETTLIGERLQLSWSSIEGIERYSVLFVSANGEREFFEDINQNELLVDYTGGEVTWSVRAQCESGHVSWSKLEQDTPEERLANLFQISPNPVTTYVKIGIREELINKEVFISDIYGEIKKVISLNNNLVDVADLKPGIYYVNTKYGDVAGTFIKM